MAGNSIWTILGPLHPPEDRLLQALRRHPADPRGWMLRCHYVCCGSCRRAASAAEASDLRLFVRHQGNVDLHLPEADQSRRRLIAAMRSQKTQSSVAGGERSSRPLSVHILGATLTIAVACLLVVLGLPRHSPSISATDLLQRAVASQPLAEATPGVIVQRVEVRAGGRTYPMTLYRDRQGRRRPRLRSVSSEETSLAIQLAAAGVSQQDPLSIASYRDWHDHLKTASDSVTCPTPSAITISTVVRDYGSSPVRAESITLRDGDLHPVSRSVEFRTPSSKALTVEIAELNYEVVPWITAGTDWFESDAPPAVRIHMARTLASPASAAAPLTDLELNLAELNVRLLLSREEADVNEQVEVARESAGIVVRGVVSSQERKQKLQSEVAAIANARAEFATPEERENLDSRHPKPTASTAPMKLVETVSGPSPLLEYWTRLHRDPVQLPELASALLDSGIKVRQQARALRELLHEFAEKRVVGRESGAAFDALLQDHEARLRTALADQSQILNRLAPDLLSNVGVSSADTGDLAVDKLLNPAESLDREASNAMDICRRLTTGQDPVGPPRAQDAETLLGELTHQESSISAALGALASTNFQSRR